MVAMLTVIVHHRHHRLLLRHTAAKVIIVLTVITVVITVGIPIFIRRITKEVAMITDSAANIRTIYVTSTTVQGRNDRRKGVTVEDNNRSDM